MWIRIEKMIREELSPEQITGHLKDIGEPSVSPEWIYQHRGIERRLALVAKARGDVRECTSIMAELRHVSVRSDLDADTARLRRMKKRKATRTMLSMPD
jgi:hypothetical protein